MGSGESMTLWILGGIHPVVDFGVERHTLVTEEIIQVFHHSSAIVTQCLVARAHSSRVRVQLLRGFLVDLSHPGRILRFHSDPFERKARRIFSWFLTKFRRRNHLGNIFQTWECDTFGGYI